MVIHCTTLEGATLITDRGALYISYHLEMNANKASVEKEMATYSSILARRIPWIEEPGRLQSMGSQRVRHKLENEQEQEVFNEMLRNWIGLNWFGWSCSKSLM